MLPRLRGPVVNHWIPARTGYAHTLYYSVSSPSTGKINLADGSYIHAYCSLELKRMQDSIAQ